jgi:hypothetical protein
MTWKEAETGQGSEPRQWTQLRSFEQPGWAACAHNHPGPIQFQKTAGQQRGGFQLHVPARAAVTGPVTACAANIVKISVRRSGLALERINL